MRKRHLFYALIGIFAFSMVGLIITSSALNLIYDIDFYRSEFSDRNITVSNPVEKTMVILSFFKGEDGILAQDSVVFLDESFNMRELRHLKDVRVLIKKIEIIYHVCLIALLVTIISAFLLIFSYSKKRRIKYHILKFFQKSLFFSVFFSTLLIFIFLVIQFWFYDIFFEMFHKLLFESGSWLFSTQDLLIRLFPFEFFSNAFFEIVKNIGVLFLGLILVLFIVQLELYSEKKRSSFKNRHKRNT